MPNDLTIPQLEQVGELLAACKFRNVLHNDGTERVGLANKHGYGVFWAVDKWFVADSFERHELAQDDDPHMSREDADKIADLLNRRKLEPAIIPTPEGMRCGLLNEGRGVFFSAQYQAWLVVAILRSSLSVEEHDDGGKH